MRGQASLKSLGLLCANFSLRQSDVTAWHLRQGHAGLLEQVKHMVISNLDEMLPGVSSRRSPLAAPASAFHRFAVSSEPFKKPKLTQFVPNSLAMRGLSHKSPLQTARAAYNAECTERCWNSDHFLSSDPPSHPVEFNI